LNFVEFVLSTLTNAQKEIQIKYVMPYLFNIIQISCTQWRSLNAYAIIIRRVLSKVELLLMKVVDAQGKENISEQKKINDQLLLETSTVRVDLLPEVFWDLAASHHNLKGIKILGIPFKEKEDTHSDKPADFNVILLMKSSEKIPSSKKRWILIQYNKNKIIIGLNNLSNQLYKDRYILVNN